MPQDLSSKNGLYFIFYCSILTYFTVKLFGIQNASTLNMGGNPFHRSPPAKLRRLGHLDSNSDMELEGCSHSLSPLRELQEAKNAAKKKDLQEAKNAAEKKEEAEFEPLSFFKPTDQTKYCIYYQASGLNRMLKQTVQCIPSTLNT